MEVVDINTAPVEGQADAEPRESDEKKSTPRRKSVTEKLQGAFTFAKRVALKTLGEIQLPPEEEELQEKLGAFQLDCVAILELRTRATQFHNAQTVVCQNQTAFAETLAKLGSHSKSGSASCVTVQEFVPYNLRLQGQQKEFNDNYQKTILEPLESLVTNEVTMVKELLKRYEAARLELGDRNRSFKHKANDVNATHVKESEDFLKKIQEELVERIGIVGDKKNALLQNSLVDFIKEQYTYFNESSKICCAKNDHKPACVCNGETVSSFEASFSLPKGDDGDEQ